jgi:hypothetical protein
MVLARNIDEHQGTLGDLAMYIWELIAHRLRCEGWSVWHRREQAAAAEPTYTVIIHRPGLEWRASGPTLTDAFGAAARRARASRHAPAPAGAPHFGLAGTGAAPLVM